MTRPTQLRARWLVPTGVRAVWWVAESWRPLAELVDDAIGDVPDVLFELHVMAVGPDTWHRVTGPDRSTWLVLDVGAREWQDPRRDRDRRATTPLEIR